MNARSEMRADIADLIFRLREGILDAAELGRLGNWLAAAPENRTAYLEMLAVLAGLTWIRGECPAVPDRLAAKVDASAGVAPAAERKTSPVLGFLGPVLRSVSNLAFSPTAIACTVAGGLLTYFTVLAVSLALTRAPGEDAGAPHRPTIAAAPAARIAMTADCRWRGSRPAPLIGDGLPAGVSRLAQGAVELEFGHGARVCIEAPAEFAPRGADGIELLSGRLLAELPPAAAGFTVTTKAAEVVDLGTEFGVAVDERGAAEVHVLRGTVEVFPVGDVSDSAPLRERRLTGGQSLRITVGGAPEDMTYDDKPFARVRDVIADAAARSRRSSPALGSRWAPIWLGDLFDDPAGTPLAQAMDTDTYAATPDTGDLGVEYVVHGGDRPKTTPGGDFVAELHFADGLIQIARGISFDFSNLGWGGKLHGSIANDAYGKFNTFATSGFSTRGVAGQMPDYKLEEGIGMHADSLITFNIDKIRAAGQLQGRRLEFLCDRAGMNDDEIGSRSAASFHMIVLVSDRAGVRTAIVDGRDMRLQKHSGVWNVDSPPSEPLRANGQFFRLRVALPSEARYLTLVVTSANQDNNMDHGVWSGAHLEVADPGDR